MARVSVYPICWCWWEGAFGDLPGDLDPTTLTVPQNCPPVAACTADRNNGATTAKRIMLEYPTSREVREATTEQASPGVGEGMVGRRIFV